MNIYNAPDPIEISKLIKEEMKKCREENPVKCDHNWIFQETKKKYSVSGYEHYTAHYHRVDRYYCSKCCEINEIEKKEAVNLPFGGIRKVLNYAPTWY